ncbi:hypothetical protein [Echinimonas agarilytica]|uniref:Uncharacterized protein n=1 Tax=Echinimonas agarilytica TaxID=1215918 RepID=A0AA41W656_9GAMM|nr:hypothetical protein [Echinimonas agarilytica]MCM2679416.1 hypothetical protein [Echinimonas agarilytica]
MNTQITKLKPLSAMIATIMLSACGSDSPQRPEHMDDTIPDALLASNFVAQENIDVPNWSEEGAQVPSGQAYIWSVLDSDGNPLPVTGLSKFANHKFTVTSTTGENGAADAGDGTVLVPNELRCPGDEDFMIPETVPYNIAQLRVDGFKTRQSVNNTDTLDFAFEIPENRYGVEYQAQLEYAGDTFDFAIKTQDLENIVPDYLLFNRFVAEYYPEKSLDDTVPTDIKLSNVAQGQLVKIRLNSQYDNDNPDFPIGVDGLDPFYKVNFQFNSITEQTFVYDEQEELANDFPGPDMEFEVGQEYPSIWYVNRQTSSATSALNPYGACAKLGDFIEVLVMIPEQAFAETYQAKLQWPNAAGDMDQYSFTISTAAEDALVDESKLDIGKVYDLPLGEDHLVPVTVEGFNTSLPISIAGTGVSYSIDGGEFTTEPGVIVPGQTLELKYDISNLSAENQYYAVFEPVLTLGELSFTGYARTIPDPAWPVLKNTLEFPMSGVATDGATATLRGIASVAVSEAATASTPTLDTSNIQVSVNGGEFENVESIDANGAWQISITLAEGENSVVYKDEPPKGLAGGISHELKITKLASADATFPADFTLPDGVDALGLLQDMTVDTKAANPVFYIVDQNETLRDDLFNNDNKRDDQVLIFTPSKSGELTNLYSSLITTAEYVFDISLSNNRAVGSTPFLFHSEHWASARTYDLSSETPLDVTLPASEVKGGTTTGKSTVKSTFSFDDDKVYVAGNSGLGVHTFDPVTGALGDIEYLNSIGSVRTIAIYQDASGTEFVFVSSRNNANTWVVEVDANDLSNSVTTPLTLEVPDGFAFDGGKMEDMAINPVTGQGFVADGTSLLTFDATNIAANKTITLTHTPSSGEYGELMTVLSEPGLSPLLLLDNSDKAIYVVDQMTGERMTVLKFVE